MEEFAGLRMRTSCYAMLRRISVHSPNAVPVGISCGKPGWAKCGSYDRIAPGRHLLSLLQDRSIDMVDFTHLYSEILNKLDPHDVIRELAEFGNDIIMLCWCSRDVANGAVEDTVCHRRIAAEWLEANSGIVIPEYGFERVETQNLLDFD